MPSGVCLWVVGWQGSDSFGLRACLCSASPYCLGPHRHESDGASGNRLAWRKRCFLTPQRASSDCCQSCLKARSQAHSDSALVSCAHACPKRLKNAHPSTCPLSYAQASGIDLRARAGACHGGGELDSQPAGTVRTRHAVGQTCTQRHESASARPGCTGGPGMAASEVPFAFSLTLVEFSRGSGAKK